jgi:hypothetical protein
MIKTNKLNVNKKPEIESINLSRGEEKHQKSSPSHTQNSHDTQSQNTKDTWV